MEEWKDTLFEFCKFYEDTANRMYCVGNKELGRQFIDYRNGVMAVITSLRLDGEYETYKEANN